jgi:hypothetical protein
MDIDAVCAEATGGDSLDEATTYRLERGFQLDLSAVRVHADGVADRVTRALDTDACAAGPHLFFRSGAYEPRSAAGLALLAHEVAHSVQQQVDACGPHAEQEADLAARSVLAGRTVRLSVRPRVLAPRRPQTVQRHESYEHRSLGDVPTADIVSITSRTDPARFSEIIERETALMWKWHQDPEKVQETDITGPCPWITPIRLPMSGLLVTYGELNALPDYLANVYAIDACPKDVLLPILQSIRQETYTRLNALRGVTKTDRFEYAPFGPNDWSSKLLNKVFNSWAMDDLTVDLGDEGINHYLALLGRNACHFAPYTWYRWQASYVAACAVARRAHAAGDAGDRARLTVDAWKYHGYADHFLQDSFAAGHLVNKTLVMQWFVKWAAKTTLFVEDWDLIKDMTAALQPGLSGPQLYSPTYAGLGTDPQTVEEQGTYAERLALSGVVAYKDAGNNSIDQKTAYQRYLTFLSSVIAQSASNALHDAFNDQSVWVASETHSTPYQVYGDDTLFAHADATDGAKFTSEAAQLSKQSIQDILANGSTEITTEQLRNCFPTRVGNTKDTVDTLQNWAFGQEQWAIDNVFSSTSFGVARVATQVFPRILNFSKDQEFANKWYTSLPGSRFYFTDTLVINDRLFASSNGLAYELGPTRGDVKNTRQVSSYGGDTFIASDGAKLFIGCHGYVSAQNLSPWSEGWQTPMTGSSSWPVHLLYSGGRLFAGSNGAVHELDPASGTRLHSMDVSAAYGPEARLATDGKMLFVGCHGYAFGIDLGGDWSNKAWTMGMTGASYSNVQLVFDRGRLFAGSNGTVHQLDTTTGERLHSLAVSSAVDEEVRMVVTDQDTVVVGCHGYAYGVHLNDWSQSAWKTPMAGKLFKMVDLALHGDYIYAASNGYIHRLDAANGQLMNAMQLGYIAGSGDYTPSLTISPKLGLYVGMHGYVYDMLL